MHLPAQSSEISHLLSLINDLLLSRGKPRDLGSVTPYGVRDGRGEDRGYYDYRRKNQ